MWRSFRGKYVGANHDATDAQTVRNPLVRRCKVEQSDI